MFNKMLECYKKREWLLYIAIFLQFINFMIISFRNQLSGTGAFNQRVLNLWGCVVLGLYLLIECSFVICDFIKNLKQEKKDKKQIIFDVVKIICIAVAFVFAAVSCARFFTDRLNYFADYNTTHLLGAVSSVIAVALVVVKRFKSVGKTCFSCVLLAISFVSALSACITIEELESCAENNFVLMSAMFFLLFVIWMNEGEWVARIATYIAIMFGCTIMIEGYITGGIHTFLNADLFEYAKFGNIVGAMVTIPSVITFAYDTLKTQNKKMKYLSLAASAVALVFSCTWFYYTIGIEMKVPADMKLLELSFIFYILAYAFLFISMMLNLRNKYCSWAMVGANAVVMVISVILMSMQRGKANHAEFYGTEYLIVYILMMVMLVATVVIKNVFAIKEKKEQIS